MEHDIALDWVDVNAVVNKIENDEELNGFEAIFGYAEPFEYDNGGEEQPNV